MGYRSDVMVVIYPDVTTDEENERKYEQLKVLMQTAFRELIEDDFGAYMEWIDDSKVLKFDLQSVKWYDSYPDVRRFMDMLHTLHGDHNDGDDIIGGYCTEFMRIGEDYNDVEHNCEGYNVHGYLSVNREIVCDV